MSALQDSLDGTDYGVALLSQEATALHHTRSPRCSGSLLRGSLAITTTGLPPVSHQDLSRRTNWWLDRLPGPPSMQWAMGLAAEATGQSPTTAANAQRLLLAKLREKLSGSRIVPVFSRD